MAQIEPVEDIQEAPTGKGCSMKAIVLALLIGLCASYVHATKIEFGMQFEPVSYFRYNS